MKIRRIMVSGIKKISSRMKRSMKLCVPPQFNNARVNNIPTSHVLEIDWNLFFCPVDSLINISLSSPSTSLKTFTSGVTLFKQLIIDSQKLASPYIISCTFFPRFSLACLLFVQASEVNIFLSAAFRT